MDTQGWFVESNDLRLYSEVVGNANSEIVCSGNIRGFASIAELTVLLNYKMLNVDPIRGCIEREDRFETMCLIADYQLSRTRRNKAHPRTARW